MIIYDKPKHKIDIEFVRDTQAKPKVCDVNDPNMDEAQPADWVQLTIFHLKADSEWTAKVTRLSPDAALRASRDSTE